MSTRKKRQSERLSAEKGKSQAGIDEWLTPAKSSPKSLHRMRSPIATYSKFDQLEEDPAENMAPKPDPFPLIDENKQSLEELKQNSDQLASDLEEAKKQAKKKKNQDKKKRAKERRRLRAQEHNQLQIARDMESRETAATASQLAWSGHGFQNMPTQKEMKNAWHSMVKHFVTPEDVVAVAADTYFIWNGPKFVKIPRAGDRPVRQVHITVVYSSPHFPTWVKQYIIDKTAAGKRQMQTWNEEYASRQAAGKPLVAEEGQPYALPRSVRIDGLATNKGKEMATWVGRVSKAIREDMMAKKRGTSEGKEWMKKYFSVTTAEETCSILLKYQEHNQNGTAATKSFRINYDDIATSEFTRDYIPKDWAQPMNVRVKGRSFLTHAEFGKIGEDLNKAQTELNKESESEASSAEPSPPSKLSRNKKN